MKYFNLSITILLLSLLVLSCTDEPVVKTSGETVIRFNIVTAEEGVVNVRSAGTDAAISNLYVVVLSGADDNATIDAYAQAKTSGNGIYYASLKSEDVEGKSIVVLANIERIMAANSDFGSTLGELKQRLVVQLQNDGKGHIMGDASPIPMVSEVTSYESGYTPSLRLQRSAAKVYVKDKSNNDSYQILGINMANVSSKGAVFEGITVSNNEIGNYVGELGGNYSIEYMMGGVEMDDPTQSDPLYVFYTPKSHEPSVILKGSYDGVEGYMRLALWDQNKLYYDITRNNQYIIMIKKITTSGYRTAEEAIRNDPANIGNDFDITVTDPSSHDIVSNGAQYLGVSNSSLMIYNSNEVKGLVALTYSYTANQDWINQGAKGIITATGDGLFLENGGKTADITLQEKTENQQLKINCTEAFIQGTLTLHFGNLSKVIRVEKRESLSATPDEMEFDNMTLGEQGGSDMRDYITFAEESGKYDSKKQQSDQFISNTNKVYSLVSANVGYGDNLRERNGEFYVASSADDGRIKIAFHQQKLDVYAQGEKVQIEPYTFVGTFHRWDETAERIIRIKTTQQNTAIWKAIVVVGQDFIELSPERSPDPGITIYPYGVKDIASPETSEKDNANWKTRADVEANAQFRSEEKGKILVSGIGRNVYFRVGMKSKLPSENSTPRYGLIALLYSKGVHLIYVRQGENADYLMRPNDPVNSAGVSLSGRKNAAKILPYNTTVLDGEKGKVYFDIPENSGSMTDYPSKGGYLFFGGTRRAILGVGSNNSPYLYDGNTTGNPCPAGYRKVKDDASAWVSDSEVRQSFWLNPVDGEAKSSYANMLRGYIADGYYDRRPMRFPNTDGRTNEGKTFPDNNDTYNKIPTLVGDGADIGFAGLLLYNPHNYASIFIPSAGAWQLDKKTGNEMYPIGLGTLGNIWTSTPSSSIDNPWYLSTGPYAPSDARFIFDMHNQSNQRHNAFSIRCVRK